MGMNHPHRNQDEHFTGSGPEAGRTQDVAGSDRLSWTKSVTVATVAISLSDPSELRCDLPRAAFTRPPAPSRATRAPAALGGGAAQAPGQTTQAAPAAPTPDHPRADGPWPPGG